MLEFPGSLRTTHAVGGSIGWAPAWKPEDPETGGEISRAFRGVVEHVPHGVLIFDEAGEIVVANRPAEAIFGYTRGQLIGERIDQLLPEWKRVDTIVQGARTGTDGRFDGIRGDGSTVPLEVGWKTLIEGRRCYTVASVIDVTDRLRLEARLLAATTGPIDVQRLIADLADRFVAIEPEEVDDAVAASLRRIGEMLHLDHVILWHKPADQEALVASHFWIRGPQAATPPDPLPLDSIPFTASKLDADQPLSCTNVAELPHPVDRETFYERAVRSIAVVPVTLTGAPGERGALAISSAAANHDWAPAIVEHLRLVSVVFGQALARRASQLSLRSALDDLRQLRERIAADNVQRRPIGSAPRTSALIVSESASIQLILQQVQQVAPTPATVLLLGETGAGKEVFAQAIHDQSPRHRRPMIRVNCAAIPTALIESELFGRERGAYTGALTRQIGRFETANQSTLFLDEIGDLPAEVQVKLLRVLQDKVIERLGNSQPIKIDVRIIAATNRNLEKAVADATFREDLFYRLNVFPMVVPPLRERAEDIPALVWEFIDEFSRSLGKPIDSISQESMQQLQRYHWPGNVRELRNVIERAVIVATSPRLTIPVPQPAIRRPEPASTLADFEFEHIRATLESTNWRIRGQGGAAERLGLKPTTLESRIAKLGLTRPNV
jgi:PAS domain S-box-containing protein